MANKRIDQLTEIFALNIQGTDELPISSGGFTRKIKCNSMRAFFAATGAESVFSTVKANSAVNWNYQGTDLKALSSNWDQAYTTVRENSAANWSYQGTDLKDLSGSWQAAATVTQAISSIEVIDINEDLTLDDSHSGKTFHFDTTAKTLSATFSYYLHNGFYVNLVNTGINEVKIASGNLKSIGNSINVRYGSAKVYVVRGDTFASGNVGYY